MGRALFISEKEWRGQETAREIYNRFLGYLGEWLISQGLTIEKMTVEHWQDFVDFRGWAYKAQRLGLSASRYWLRQAGLTGHPLFSVAWPEGIRKPQRTLKLSQRERLLEAASTTRSPKRDTAMIRLLWDVGGRKFEIADALWDKADLEDHTIWLLTKAEDLKPRQWELKRFSPETADALGEWAHTGTTGTIFGLQRSGITMVLRRLSAKTGFKASPHDFRRGLISYMSESGVSDTLGMQQTGIKTHSIYAQYGQGARLKALDGQIW